MKTTKNRLSVESLINLIIPSAKVLYAPRVCFIYSFNIEGTFNSEDLNVN